MFLYLSGKVIICAGVDLLAQAVRIEGTLDLTGFTRKLYQLRQEPDHLLHGLIRCASARFLADDLT